MRHVYSKTIRDMCDQACVKFICTYLTFEMEIEQRGLLKNLSVTYNEMINEKNRQQYAVRYEHVNHTSVPAKYGLLANLLSEKSTMLLLSE